MKTLIYLTLLFHSYLLIGQSENNICFEHMEQKNHFFCTGQEEITYNLYDARVVFCKKDTLENNKFVKNCLIVFPDTSNIFISSQICEKNKEIKVVYVEYCNSQGPMSVEEKDREKYKKFFLEMDRFLRRLAPYPYDW